MPKNSSGLICSTFKITSVKIDSFIDDYIG